MKTDVHPQVIQLSERLLDAVPKTQGAAIEAFTQLYYAGTPSDELDNRKVEDLYGATLALWGFIQKCPSSCKIRVFNPDFEEHGWQSTHTIVEIMHPDVPFLVDSIRMELNRREMAIHFINHAVLPVARNKKGELDVKKSFGDKEGKAEAAIYIEVDRHTDEAMLQDLAETLDSVLGDIRLVVDDFSDFKEKVDEVKGWIKDSKGPFSEADIKEATAFVDWLAANNFTFLGCEDFDMSSKGHKTLVSRDNKSVLGTFKHELHGPDEIIVGDLPVNMQALIMAPQLVSFTKSGRRSRIHRPAYPDYVTIKHIDKNGQVVGGRRFMGLFTSSVYTQTTFSIPLLRKKAKLVMDKSGFDPSSHNGKELHHILDMYPRDELFHTDVDQLTKSAVGILNIQERRRTQIFIRHDQLNKFLSCMVYVPRDLYNTELRQKIQTILVEAFAPEDVEFTTFFSESTLSRTLFVLRLDPKRSMEYDLARIEKNIQAVARSWQDDLMSALLDGVGEEKGNQYFQQYRTGFGASYREEFSARTAVVDIKHITSMKNDDDVAMSLYRDVSDAPNHFKFKLYNPDSLLPLSDVIPILENLGLRVIGEHPYGVTRTDGKMFWIHDFTLIYTFSDSIDLHESKEQFQDAFRAIWFGKAENDSFNRLLLGAKIGWREVALLRAYARYMKQIRFGFSESFIADTLCKYPDLTSYIVEYFQTRFGMESEAERNKKLEVMDHHFVEVLEDVESINEDRIYRRYNELMQATLRTNFFQHCEDGEKKGYFSFKLSPRDITDIPLPKPMFEIFVYSPRVEGVHLRGGKVARGGLRWSDRNEDFRTEVLGLVKAQQVKNSVIVPVGAKGGFVAKQLPEGDRDAFLAEGVECYKIFISGLLDVTDNLIEGEVIPPKEVVRHDEDDPYLVVAADKGTATFSDISNGIATERGFWLGDAFASGGSVGYDHKKMGITAKGAWVSVQRHFRERGINVQEEPITVIAVGDMAGDVFGNGMLRSEHLKLVAAFNHLHIFIDPDPQDVSASFKERERLFELPRSAWSDYDASLISAGGGVFDRKAKSLDISPQMRQAFNIQQERMSPNDLINALLKAPVDLIWNGGIGTYVKSSDESHADAGDKANDSLRINGKDLRTKVIGEGGNLGITQKARIEFALHSKGEGSSFTDFIDNAAGVDCSDHEVNIKILLNGLVQSGDMTVKQRNELLEAMTDEVSDLVLINNYRQTQAIALAYREAKTRIDEYKRLIHDLEKQDKLNRELEFLPNDEELEERKNQKQGLTRPELSVLISYTKGDLKELLNVDEISQNQYLAQAVETAFPKVLVERFPDNLYGHQLRSEIVATQLANEMVNRMGISYVNRMRDSTGADINTIVKAYVAARDVFRMDELWEQIEALDYKVTSDIQEKMMSNLMRLIRRASRWFLRNRRRELNLQEEVDRFKDRAMEISGNLANLLAGESKEAWQALYNELMEAGVPEELAITISGANNMFSALSIIEGAEQSNCKAADVAATYFQVGCNLDLEWFLSQLNAMSVQNHWQALARETYRDDLDWQQRTLTVSIINANPDLDMDKRLHAWLDKSEAMIQRWRVTVDELKEGDIADFAVFAVALRELLDLAQASRVGAKC